MDVVVLLISLILVAGAGRTSHANSETAMDYWQTLLPRTPMPPAILDLLSHHAGSNNLKFVRDSKNVHAALQAEEDLKEISVSYGSQGNKKDLKNDMIVDTSQFPKDLKKIPMPPRPDTNNKGIKRSLGGSKHDKKKVMAAYLKQILSASPQNEENRREILMSHESKLEEDLKEISVSYGSKLDEDLKEISVSYGSKLDENLREISVSYGLEGKQDSKKVSVEDLKKILAARSRNEENLKEISVSYGSKLEEDLKEISVSYGSKLEEDLKEISVSYGLEGKQDMKKVSAVELKKILAARPRDEENLNEISVSYGSRVEEDKEIPVSYGSECEEDVKEISVSYGQEDKDGLKKISASEGDKAGEGHFHVHAHNQRSRRIADVFFFHDMLRPGTMMTPTIPPTSSLPALLPRHVANSIPFSPKRFHDIVAMFAPASLAMAGEMRWTLDTCEHPRPLPGQQVGCATSLESLAELPASLLGTRDVRAFSANLPIEAAGVSALRARNNVTAARRLSTSLEVVTCHDLTYPYAVFYCHTSNPTVAYMVTLESEDGAAPAMEALAVCHLDTSQWNPENPFFKLHSVNPGDVAVCHFLSKLSIIWVRSGELDDLHAPE